MKEEWTSERNLPEIRREVVAAKDVVMIQGLDRRYYSHHKNGATSNQFVTLAEILNIVWRRKRLFGAVILLICAASAIYVFTAVPIYQTRATLEVVPESSKVEFKHTTESDPGFIAKYKTQIRLLRGRSLADAVVKSMSLVDSPDFKVERPGIVDRTIGEIRSFVGSFVSLDLPKDAEALEHLRQTKTVDSLISRLSVKAFEGSRLVEVSLETLHPAIGQQILNTHIALYLQKNLDIQREALKEAQEWIQKEISVAEKSVRLARNALIDFSRDHGVVSLEGDQSNHILDWFNKMSDRFVKSKQASMQIEAHTKNAGGALPRDLSNEYLQKFRTDLALLESEYEQNKEVYSPRYPKMLLLKRKIEYLQKKIREIETTTVNTALRDSRSEEELLKHTFEKAKEAAINVNSLGIQYSIMKKELDASEELLRSLLKKKKEIDLQFGTVVNDLRVRDSPSLPLSPLKPRKRLFLLGAVIFGLFAATLVVVYVDRKDPRVHCTEDVERLLGLESLGLLPKISKFRHGIGHADEDLAKEFIACSEPMSDMSEAARSVATSIALMTSFSETSIAVCSATQSEGKTMLSISLASVVGSEGRKALVIEADLRRPRIGKLFGESVAGAGLGDLLADDNMTVEDVLRPSHLPGFYYMTAGSQPVAHPLALLKSERTARIIKECKETFEWVIIDCPPAIGLSDIQIIAPMVDGVVAVAREGHTPVHALKRLQSSVLLSRGKLLGIVINMATRWPSGYPSYLYHKSPNKNKLWNVLGRFG